MIIFNRLNFETYSRKCLYLSSSVWSTHISTLPWWRTASARVVTCLFTCWGKKIIVWKTCTWLAYLWSSVMRFKYFLPLICCAKISWSFSWTDVQSASSFCSLCHSNSNILHLSANGTAARVLCVCVISPTWATAEQKETSCLPLMSVRNVAQKKFYNANALPQVSVETQTTALVRWKYPFLVSRIAENCLGFELHTRSRSWWSVCLCFLWTSHRFFRLCWKAFKNFSFGFFLVTKP